MEQAKIGEFLKTLRKEKGLTQDDLAEKMLVSRRTVSRWETGSNLPDLSVLVELADFYDVDLREIIDGERKTTTMNEDMKETLLKAADYAEERKNRFLRLLRVMFIVTSVFGGVWCIAESVLSEYLDNHIFRFLEGVCIGAMFGMCILGAIFISGNMANRIIGARCEKK